MLFPQRFGSLFGQIPKVDPDLAARRAGKVRPPNLLAFFWKIGKDSIGVECLGIYPVDFGSLRIDSKTSLLTDSEPLFGGRCGIPRLGHHTLLDDAQLVRRLAID